MRTYHGLVLVLGREPDVTALAGAVRDALELPPEPADDVAARWRLHLAPVRGHAAVCAGFDSRGELEGEPGTDELYLELGRRLSTAHGTRLVCLWATTDEGPDRLWMLERGEVVGEIETSWRAPRDARPVVRLGAALGLAVGADGELQEPTEALPLPLAPPDPVALRAELRALRERLGALPGDEGEATAARLRELAGPARAGAGDDADDQHEAEMLADAELEDPERLTAERAAEPGRKEAEARAAGQVKVALGLLLATLVVLLVFILLARRHAAGSESELRRQWIESGDGGDFDEWKARRR